MAAGVLYPTLTQAGEFNEQVAAQQQPRGMFIGTPEIHFSKHIDNSRVVMVTDPKRRREMVTFGIMLGMLFLFAMVYLWQHFSAIEYGYKIEQLKSQRDSISETNRTLSLEEASLKDLPRIDRLAREMGMQRPVEGQWQSLDAGTTDPATPVMAKASGISVVSGLQ
jgi:cell division protein FtsL